MVIGAPSDAADLASRTFDDDSATADLFVSLIGDFDNVDTLIAAGGNDVVVGGGNDDAAVGQFEVIDAGEGDNTVLGDIRTEENTMKRFLEASIAGVAALDEGS